MQPRDWNICLIESNKFEAQIMLDLLRNAGCDRVKIVADSASALDALELLAANIIIASVEAQPIDGVTWTKAFRRSGKVVNRKAAIFLTSHAFSRSMAEECRHAGVNALIGKPVSGKVLIATLNKVMTNPREFIDAAGYVGPCRRAGIVTAGATQKRRKIDESAKAENEANTLVGAVAQMSKAISGFVTGAVEVEVCQAALKRVQAYAVNAGDGPLMRACAAFGLQLSAKGVRPEAAKSALEACMAGVAELAATSVEETQRRDAMAESVRQAVAKAASLRAA
ncbi:chemotaxis protein CheYIII [alpha proteobacterium U9-1i]|nr:chemotaxis protein CheYIII [alpha proteobacterium U9-1i]